jgi:hypothetical protein
MDPIGAADLDKLLRKQTGFCASLYMPTHVVGPQAPDDEIRLKNLIAIARHKLIEYGQRPADVRKSLEAIERLPRDAEFWGHRSQSLAIFLSDDLFERFRLGTPVNEEAIVDRRFYLKQLLPSVAADGKFFILAISQNAARLLAATPYTCEGVTVKSLPPSRDEALNLVGADRGQQVHSAMHGRFGKQAGVFHGQGGARDTAKDELVQYFRGIDAALRPVLRGSKAPLVLAMVDYEASLFREVCEYPHLAAETLSGNFDYAADHELHEQARPIAQRLFGRDREEAAARYRELADTSRASDRLEVILPAAHEGRVETLFVDPRAVALGTFDPAARLIRNGRSVGMEAEDLLDRAAVESLLRHAEVYAVGQKEMPCSSPIAAIFRY